MKIVMNNTQERKSSKQKQSFPLLILVLLKYQFAKLKLKINSLNYLATGNTRV